MKSLRYPYRTELLVVQPTPFCNISCTYCYLPHRNSTKKLELDVAERVFSRVFSFPTIRDAITIVWHAGEPMVMPVGYYEQMFSLIQRTSDRIAVQHAFQTNGTLISDEWCDLINKWSVNVGVSLDGPEEVHDLHRKFRNGTGSFASAYRGIELLQLRQIDFHVITVLTQGSLSSPESMFEFFFNAGIDNISFNIEETEGTHESALTKQKEFATEYRNFLTKFLELAFVHRPQMSVREFESCTQAILGYGKGLRNEQAEPLSILSFDTNGTISTFSPELLGMKHPSYDFEFGNVLEDSFDVIAGRILSSKLYSDIEAGRKACEAVCEYFSVCGGGAPANKIFENGTANSTQTAYCRSHQIAIDVVLDKIANH
ncbi:cyclophane-forming radical SAM/SPASM peptide maturase GrrM/OscB [Bradyrhizobium neotropicale]|uniref:cyclophane-forming radical SAM/SPASM peptide maturase GrrM/OscB n=1 Tax=Bradyrhizobium neotropicale TaxID=1497615 RepID=UPI001AD66E52|nr:cyclophane-forming radical SAM/SPASM peptide maturase GrrM/OscB [Bradyrhizobium neotropicale]MBO4226646.1 GRRM system radical SAM/SPASM domain protein [Bradyrhizobium neotropicale]